jgi:tetratricopeptide (TPR) repeat protein/SAM-dependent methyltransferase
MSRKERRAAEKQARRSGAAAAGTDPALANLFATAVRHHQAGQLAQAESGYRQILAIDKDHVDSLHFLGVLAHQVGRNDAAVELIGKAIALNQRIPECHYNIGLAYRALGRMDDAIAHNRRAIELRRDYAEAHLNLGNTLNEQGQLDEAARCYDRVIELKPDHVEAHYNLGNVLTAQGKLGEAVAYFERAIELKPDYAQAYNNLGTALRARGWTDEAAERHEQAIKIDPALVEAYVNLGTVHLAQGKWDEALALFHQALARNPAYAEAHNNIGFALMTQGNLAEARDRFQQALSLKPDLVEALNNLAKLLLIEGNADQAMPVIRRALAIKETEKGRALFVECVKGLRSIPDADDVRELFIRALSDPWGRPAQFAIAAAPLAKLDGVARELVARVNRAWPARPSASELFGPSELAALAENRLLQCLLECDLICDIELERLLTAARCALLEIASPPTGSDEVAPAVLQLWCALAKQCFINEYVFAHTDAELAEARQLRDALVDAVQTGATIPLLWPVAVAAYFPLHSLPGAAVLVETSWPEPLEDLLTLQVREPQQEAQHRSGIPQATEIADTVSIAVRQQYEESPYPRWMKPAPVAPAANLDTYLRGLFPLAPLRTVGTRHGPAVLIAGCGTGQQSIEAALLYADAQVLAIDLSLASLGYAKRRTVELGLSSIDYAQADILRLGQLGRTFDLIEASGVLHHLRDPVAGWRALLSLLRPGGVMRVGLYSELARAPIVAARRHIAEQGYGQSAEDIRRCRQELMDAADGTPLRRTTGWRDFYSTSQCRDLLFHVQEHRFTLPEIAKVVAESGVTFLGFELDAWVLRRYRTRFPDDKTMTDFACWHAFEQENPHTFVGMYQFWLQKSA